MKKKNLFPFTVLILSLIFLSGLKDIEAKAVGVKDIEHDINSVINSFFALRDASNSYSVDDKTVGNVNNDGAIFSIKKSLKISNDALSTFLSDYHKLRKIIANESNIQEDIVTSKITKNIIEQNNKIIVDVNRYKESYYTVNHVKNDYLTYESSDYRFVFSKDTGELIDYIPGDREEKTLMKSASMDRIIESEHTLRNKLKIKEETQSVHRSSQFESKKRMPSAEYRKVSVFLLSKVSTVYPSLLKLFGFLLSRPYTYEEVVEYRYCRLL